MKKNISTHIISRLDLQSFVSVLARELNGSELNTVLLDVFNKRVQQETASTLLNKYARNKLVKPFETDVIKLKENELSCYKLLASKGFEPIELSPVAQLGTSSVVATVDQKKVLTALRNTEVQADPTNAIALHYAWLKKKRVLGKTTRNYSNISRILRTQAFSNPHFTPHFSVLCLVSCGRDTGSFNFEREELLKQISISSQICKEVFGIQQLYFEIIPGKGYDSLSPMITDLPDSLAISVVEPDNSNNYYYGFRIKMKIVLDDVVYEIGDGGLLDWTQQLLANKKERMMTMGIGFQILHQLTAK
ncbi:hypothetical protein AAHN97_12485 [Chitinophaga niabensis]|uniref:hypothetical protein n=1 Tax=Chitinophaga niabensis TaxID=536979 RepID=UPI0031B9DB5A